MKATCRALKPAGWPQPRLICLNVENVVGGARRRPSLVEWAQRELFGAIGAQPDEHVVIGISEAGWLAVGAVSAIVQMLTDENVVARFSEFVLVIGDGIFSETIAAVAPAGLPTAVVAHRDGLAHRLRMVAAQVIYLPCNPRRNNAWVTDAAGRVA
jgi:hypothetical protein